MLGVQTFSLPPRQNPPGQKTPDNRGQQYPLDKKPLPWPKKHKVLSWDVAILANAVQLI